MTQGSVLGPVRFNIFINEPGDRTEFADGETLEKQMVSPRLMPLEGSLTVWRKGLEGTPCSSTRGGAKFSTCRGIMAGTSVYWVIIYWKAALQKRIWGSC